MLQCSSLFATIPAGSLLEQGQCRGAWCRPPAALVLSGVVERAEQDSILREKYLFQRSLSQGGVNWWALSLLDLKPDSIQYQVRQFIEDGFPERVTSKERRLKVWEQLRQQAADFAEQKSLEQWREEAAADPDGPIAKQLRHAALRSPRAFVKICHINHRGIVWELDNFQVKAVNAMRREKTAAIFLPLEHGKSAIGSILVPLMDWGEWVDSTQCRVYWNQSNSLKWVGLLQSHVEYSLETHQVFPWIRRPDGEDRARYWAQDRFSIGGRSNNLPSFEALTAKQNSVGNRYSRTICDDWVNPDNSGSILTQNKLENYLLAGPMTFREFTEAERVSEYGTRWGTMSYCGTFFDKRDVGYRFHGWCVENGYTAIKFDVYPLGAGFPDVLLWIREGGPEHIEDLRKSLRKMFNKRMRNIIIDEGRETFNPDDVEDACRASLNAGDQYRFGQIPRGATAMIGFDPAAGSRGKNAANPAISLYGEVYDVDDHGMETGQITAHFIAWEQLHGYDFTKQCNTIVEWARRYLVPVVIEKNTLQAAYKNHIKTLAPDVRVYDHQTGCVDTDTKALTPRGWKFHYELKIGDLIYAVDPLSGTGSWKPILDMTRYHHSGDAYRFQHRNMTVTTSPEHRWLVEWVGNKGKWRGRRWSTSETLMGTESIPLGASLSEDPRATISDDIVELLGWFLTEGWYRRRSLKIAQSPVANPHKCQRIERLLDRLGAKGSKGNNGKGVNVYHVYGEVAEEIGRLAPGKCLTVDTVKKLTARQRTLLWHTMIAGDGSLCQKGGEVLATDSRSEEAVTMLMALNGWTFSVTEVTRETNFKRNKPTVTIRRKLKTKSSGRPKLVQFDGTLWCPTVEGGAWLAVNNGRPFVSGNSEKWDPDDGVETFSPFFEDHRAVIHAYLAPEQELRDFIEQLVDWPQPKLKDILMAFWFARSKMRKRQKVQSRREPMRVPEYLRDMASYWRIN